MGEIIVVTVDESLSMIKTDFKPRRIDVVRESLFPFIKSLLERDMHTLIGLVGFYKIAYPISYPTDDQELLLEAVQSIRVKGEASASGDALNLASLLLQASTPPGYKKRIILITDDTSNAGIPLSMMALPLKSMGVQVDIVAMGKIPRKALEDLKLVASSTNGRLLQVSSEKQLLPALYQLI